MIGLLLSSEYQKYECKKVLSYAETFKLGIEAQRRTLIWNCAVSAAHSQIAALSVRLEGNC